MSQTTPASRIIFAASPETTRQHPSLKRLALRGSAWTIVSYGASQVLRLGSNLVLSRLLFPEAFGLMALVAVFIQGLQMFSDVGIGPAIVQNKRGDEPAFLNTAWTMQAARGGVLWIVASLGAWPAAKFFNQPALRWLLPVAALSAAIAAFNSTSLFTLKRRLQFGKLAALDLGTYAFGLAVMVVWALLHRSVWALVAGGIASSVARMAFSHRLVSDHRNRLHWDRECAKVLFSFGRWVFLSTVLTFLSTQLDRVIVGKALGPTRLGLYSIAIALAMVVPQVLKQLTSSVFFPVYADLARRHPNGLYSRARKARASLLLPTVCALLLLAAFGDRVVGLLYDVRYREAGWMLRVLAAGAIAGAISATYGSVLWAVGATLEIMCLLISQLVILLAVSFVGYHWWGERGFVTAVASVEWINYVLVATMVGRKRLWQPELDVPILLLSLAAILILIAR